MNNLGRYTLYIQNLTDVISLTLAFFVSRFIRFTLPFITYTGYSPDAYWRFYLSVIVAYVVVDIFVLCRENILERNNSKEFLAVFKTVVYIFAMVLVFTYLTKTSEFYSRIFFGIFGLVSLFFMYVGRVLIKNKIFPMYQQSNQSRKVVLVGPLENVQRTLSIMKDSDDWRFSVNALVITDDDLKGEYVQNIKVISNVSDMYQDIVQDQVDAIYIVPKYIDDRIIDWTKHFCEAGKSVFVNIDDFGGLTEYNRVTDQIAGNNVLSYLPVVPVPGRQAIVKRVLDVMLAILLVPVFFVISFLSFVFTKLESNGPIIYNRIRVSKNGRRYYQYRFRMLRMDAKERIKDKETPFTKFGVFLRLTHLDGLPMILNVLSGDMGFVGPHSPRFSSYVNYEPDRRKNLCVRAGIVGYWSCEEGLPQITKDERDYIENWTIFKDLNILLRMIGRYLTFNSSKTYSKTAFKEEYDFIREINEFSKPLEYDRSTYQGKEDGIFYAVIKRTFDFLMSLIAIILLSPILLILSVLVISDDGGSPFYGHERIGKNGKRIMVYKFRSMRKDAGDLERLLTPEQLDQYKREFKIDDDPRVTNIGEFLRKSSLDELPQLFNILSGDLSIVGPRPIVEKETERYGDDIAKFLSVKPGLTGYWQAYARNNATYESGERQRMEMYYVDHRGILLDIRIIFKTFISVLKREGAQ